MATFTKRKNKNGTTIRAEVRIKGKRISKTFESKEKAKFWANAKENELTLQKENELDQCKTFLDMLERYMKEVSPGKPSHRWEKIRASKLAQSDLAEISLADLDSSHIALYRDERLQTVQGSTVNRELNFISAMFTRAMKEWQWAKHNPVAAIKRPANNRHRDRRISESEIELIVRNLKYKPGPKPQMKMQETALAFLLAIETAMRAGEILSLKWENVFLEKRYVHLVKTKNGDTRDVPLSKRAVELLKQMEPESRGSVFSVTSGVLDTSFRKARAKAEIDDLTFHDSRHEALTRMAKKLSVLELARTVGHRDPRSLMIYYNATASEIAQQLD